MKNNGVKYVPVCGVVVPCYRYIDDGLYKSEEFWVDCQNCEYYTYLDGHYDEGTNLVDGHDWWIIYPYVPEEMRFKNVGEILGKHIKWIVEDSNIEEDIDREWDFKKHKVKKNGIKIEYWI